MDSSNPGPSSETLPAFGSAIFSFNSARDRPCISAHVSVLFLEDKPEADEGDDGDDGKGKKKEDNSASVEIVASKEAEAEVVLGCQQKGEASSSKKKEPLWEELEEMGWGAIIEEMPEEDIPEELRYRGPA